MSYRPYLESGALGQMHGLPEQAFEMLKAGLAENAQESAYEKDQHWDGAGVPDEPAPSAQELLGPDIAKTR